MFRYMFSVLRYVSTEPRNTIYFIINDLQQSSLQWRTIEHFTQKIFNHFGHLFDNLLKAFRLRQQIKLQQLWEPEMTISRTTVRTPPYSSCSPCISIGHLKGRPSKFDKKMSKSCQKLIKNFNKRQRNGDLHLKCFYIRVSIIAKYGSINHNSSRWCKLPYVMCFSWFREFRDIGSSKRAGSTTSSGERRVARLDWLLKAMLEDYHYI